MTKRKEQVYTKIIKDFVAEHGRVPTEGELHKLSGNDMYVPLTVPIVPKDKAVSNTTYFKSTVQGLLDDGYDIMNLIKYQTDQIKQLRTAMQARQVESELNLRNSINEIRLQETLEDSRAAVVGILPEPLERLSTNVIRSGDTITLLSDHSYPIEYSIVDMKPFADKSVRRSQLGEFTIPYTAIVAAEKTSAYSGIQFQMLLTEEALVTRLHYEGSSCFGTVEILNGNSEEWQAITSKHFSGDDDIAISENAIRIRITLTQDLNRSLIRISDLLLFQERYPSQGSYTSSPIKLVGTGSLDFNFEQYVPKGTNISWEYAIDSNVSGDYVNLYGDSVPLDSPSFGNATYNSIAASAITFATIAGYDLNEQYQSPAWDTMDGSALYNIESGNYPEFTGSSEVGPEQSPVIDLATISEKAVDGMVNITYGKNAWIFRVGTLERAVIDESGIRRMAMTGYPHWSTHLLVENDFELSVDDPYERINYILLELGGHVLVLKRPFTYTLVKGIWKCTIAIDDEYLQTQEDLSAVNRAVSCSGIDPRTAINTVDKNGSILKFYIQPFPVPIVSEQRIFTDPDYSDFQRAAVASRIGEKHILVPDMSVDASSVDFISTTFEINSLSDIYVVSNMANFFDITYMQEVDSPAKYIFVRAKLSTTDKDLTPTIRGISLSLNDVKREPPAIVKRLKNEGSVNPLE